jgi:AcrR family transcriptional regulator
MRKRTLSARQAQIVDAALRVIATKGSRRFTAQLLAKEVGVTGGAIYRHFEGMDAIVDAVVDRVGAFLFDGFPPEAPDPIERLKVFFYRRARTILANPHVSRLLLSDHLAQAGGLAQSKRLDEFKRRSQAFVSECLREAREGGLLADGMSSQAGAVVVLGSILALSHASARLTDGAGPGLIDEVWSGIEKMLRSPRGTDEPMSRPARSARRGAKE